MRATTIADAEKQVAANPIDSHGFANAATIEVSLGVRHPTGPSHTMTNDEYVAALNGLAVARADAIKAAPARSELMRSMLRAGGYTYTDGWWVRDGYRAVAHGYEWSEGAIHVYAVGAQVALAATEGHPAESLAYGR